MPTATRSRKLRHIGLFALKWGEEPGERGEAGWRSVPRLLQQPSPQLNGAVKPSGRVRREDEVRAAQRLSPLSRGEPLNFLFSVYLRGK